MLALLGLRCSGKTSVGRALAARLGLPFVDLDEALAERAGDGRAVGELLAGLGEAAFRALESEVLRDVLARPGPFVLALGGGSLERPANRALVAERALCVRLEAPDAVLAERLAATRAARPPLRAGESPPEEVARLRAARAAHLGALAALTLETTRLEPARLAAEVAARLERDEGGAFRLADVP